MKTMRTKVCKWHRAMSFGAFFVLIGLNAQDAFPSPEGDWDYAYEGDEGHFAPDGEGFASLDGNWSHDNNSDQWDGSAIGGEFGVGDPEDPENPSNRPGGAQIIMEGEGDDMIIYLRIQDTGDPRDHGYEGEPSNRKVYFGNDFSVMLEENPDFEVSPTLMDDGVTLNFRARVPIEGLDPLHRDGQGEAGPQPYPERGDGYVTSDQGKGNFVIRQGGGESGSAGAIAFSLTTSTDTPGGNPNEGVTNFSGLSMNEFAGNVVSGSGVNFGQGEGANVVPFDPTEWHEFWITIQRDPAGNGTHLASIWMDGETTPKVFPMTAGTGSDFDGTYIAMGATATPQNAALDIDFYRVKFEAVVPEGASASPPPNYSNLLPSIGAGFVSPEDGVSFTAISSGSIPREGIKVILNGVDYSDDLQIEGNEQEWNVKLASLQLNAVYQGELLITDSGGSSISGILSFDTFGRDNRTFEAENWNFDNGEFINVPDIEGNDSYFDKGALVDSDGVDFHELSEMFDFDNDNAFRIPGGDNNLPNTASNNNEAERSEYENVPDFDYSVVDTQVGEWLNYTRSFSVGDANIYLRATDGGAYSVQLDRVIGDVASSDQMTETLGWFRSSTARGGNYQWVGLTNEMGALASVNLEGEMTLRASIIEGSPDLNFFMVTPAIEAVAPPLITISVSRNEDGTITVEWVGILQAADNVEGPYIDLPVTSPLTLPVDQAMRFARARQP